LDTAFARGRHGGIPGALRGHLPRFQRRMYDYAVMKDELRKALAGRQKLVITDCKLRPSAVLLPIFKKDGKYHIVFTKRTEHLSRHQGQISFPGGGRHADDKSLLDTALRESREEIGLRESDVEVLGELDDAATAASYFCITPFVGLIPYPYTFRPDPYEVDEIFDVAVDDLLDAKREEETGMYGDSDIKVYTYRVNGKVIWGATAWILTGLLNILRKVSGAHCGS
jgi:8-oxo-dGTP pyrophosphatase MutT (NUDIX family)